MLVIGSSSLVGSHFVESFANKYEISAIGRRNIFGDSGLLSNFREVSLQNESALREIIASSDAEFVVNYAAETNVDGCEKESGDLSGKVFVTNCESVGWMAAACKQVRKKFCQISTDFVFDGTKGPYLENDQAGPTSRKLSWYGFSKYMAEKRLIEVDPPGYCIVRTSYPYRAVFEYKLDFARNILHLFEQSRLYPMFKDQIISPTLVDDISSGVDFLISNGVEGTCHIACKEPTTPFIFASRLVSKFSSEQNPASRVQEGSILPLATGNGHRAPRPINGGLRTDRIQSLGFIPRTFEEGIDSLFKQIADHNGALTR